MRFDDVPGHEGLMDGGRAVCSCGWRGTEDYPAGEHGLMSMQLEWSRHMAPLLVAAPPGWLLTRSDGLRDNVDELSARWPLQALGVLAEVERWQRPLLEKAVANARTNGSSWAEIGTALGVTRQSAHERFRHVTS
jgi:hypothetical protein